MTSLFEISKIMLTFVSCTESFFYEKHFTNTGTKLQEGRTGESPAVISVLDIDLVHSDPSLFISQNPSTMCTKKERHPAYNRAFYLYVLRDPFTRKIRYVGIMSNPKKREKEHRTAFCEGMYAKEGSFLQWKEHLRLLNTYPFFEVIKKFSTYELAHSMEVKLINSLGDDILNIANKVPNVQPVTEKS